MNLINFDDILDDVFGEESSSRKRFEQFVADAYAKRADKFKDPLEIGTLTVPISFGAFYIRIRSIWKKEYEVKEKLEKKEIEDIYLKRKIGKYFKVGKSVYYCNCIKRFTDGQIQVGASFEMKPTFFPYTECVWET